MPTASRPTSSPSQPLTILCDLGGTNVRFALCDPGATAPYDAASVRRHHVTEFGSLADAMRGYLADTGAHPRRAVIAAAGRISDGRTVQVTNNPWHIDAQALQHALGLEAVDLINDFAAQSMAVTLLRAEDQVAIGPLPLPRPGTKASQTFVVMGPGTGLGVGALLWRDGRPIVLESEGGHAGFAAHSPKDIAILTHLNQRFGRVSNERLLSGRGVANLYATLCALEGKPAGDLRPEDITARADAGSDALCVHTVETLVGICGSIAGDLVLTLGGWDGVYLTGGLLPVLLPWIQRGSFRERFVAKGRLGETLRHVPTIAMTAAEPGLLGAAAVARRAD